MEFIIYSLIISYAICCLALLYNWSKISSPKAQKVSFSQTKISIIIPVRNEENNIHNLLQSIDSQIFNKENFDLIIANDASTDDTKKIIESYTETSELRIKLLDLPEHDTNSSPKKRAITEALKVATGELIITTDGDCTMSSNWLATITNFYDETDAFFISSPVSFRDEQNVGFFIKIWQAFQVIEFGSLIGAGACAIQIGSPNMCSGANIAYKKSIFYEVGGYAGNEHIASGDDEFLMQKIASKYPGKVHYLKSNQAIVETEAQESVSSFFQQRKRWASKWRFYKNWQPVALAIYIAIVNAVTVWALIFGRFDIVLIKFSAEFVFLVYIVHFLKKKWTILFIPLTQIFYPFYVFIVAVAAQGENSYYWKGRKLK